MLIATVALALSPAVVAGPALAEAAAPVVYSPEVLAAELAAGKAVVLDFSASWCPSCLAQGRAIQALRAENPAYDAGLVFMVADWDTWKDKEIAQRLGVTGRGAVVILKGDAIVARSDQHLKKAKMQALLDQALAVTA
jgi:thiol:disulfide interchange protein